MSEKPDLIREAIAGKLHQVHMGPKVVEDLRNGDDTLIDISSCVGDPPITKVLDPKPQGIFWVDEPTPFPWLLFLGGVLAVIGVLVSWYVTLDDAAPLVDCTNQEGNPIDCGGFRMAPEGELKPYVESPDDVPIRKFDCELSDTQLNCWPREKPKPVEPKPKDIGT